MVIKDLQAYWTFVSAARRGDPSAKLGLESMAYDRTKSARLAQVFLQEVDQGKALTAP